MKTGKRIIARILSLVMIFTTISNTYLQARASEIPGADEATAQFAEQQETQDITGEGEDFVVGEPADELPTEGDYTEPEEQEVVAPDVEATTGQGDKTPVGNDPGSDNSGTDTSIVDNSGTGTSIVDNSGTDTTIVDNNQTNIGDTVPSDDADVDLTNITPVIPGNESNLEQTDASNDGQSDADPADGDTKLVNEGTGKDVIIFYVPAEGGSVSNDQDTFNPNEGSNLTGSVAIADKGYFFKNWTAYDGNVLSNTKEMMPDANEIDYLTSLYNAGGGEVTYTANFEKIDREYEAEIENVAWAWAAVGAKAFDREVELVIEHLQPGTKKFEDAKAEVEAAGQVFDAMMAFDVYFADVETGEEVKANGAFVMDFRFLGEAIKETIETTEGVDEITTDAEIGFFHLDESGGAVKVEQVADNTQPENPETADIGTEGDREGNLQEIIINNVELDSNSIFVVTIGGQKTTQSSTVSARTFKPYEGTGSDYSTLEGTRWAVSAAPVMKDLTFTVMSNNSVQLQGYTGKKLNYAFEDPATDANLVAVYRKNGNVSWQKITGFYALDGGGNAGGMWIAGVAEDGSVHNFLNTTWAQPRDATDEYYFLINKDNLDGIRAYVYEPGTGTGQITVDGKTYVPANPAVTTVDFSAGHPVLKDFGNYSSVWRKSDSGSGYGKVTQWGYRENNGWIYTVTNDDNREHRYYRTSKGEDSTHEYVWLLSDDYDLPTGTIEANIYLLMDALYTPDPLHRGYEMGLFGPSENNVEYFKVKINLDELNKLMTPEIQHPGGTWNGNEHPWGPKKGEEKVYYYYTYRSHAASNPDSTPYSTEESTAKDGQNPSNSVQAARVTGYAESFFDDILMNEKVMFDPADRAKFTEYFQSAKDETKPNFIGYVLKRESDHYNNTQLQYNRSWHIDGIIREFPYYLLQLYEADNATQNPAKVRKPFSTHVNNVPDQYFGTRTDTDPKTELPKDVGPEAVTRFEDYFYSKYGRNIDIKWDYAPKTATDNSIELSKIYHGVITKADGTKVDFNIAPMDNREAAGRDSGVLDGGKITYQTIIPNQAWLAQFKVWFNERPTGSLQINKVLDGEGKEQLYGKTLTFRLFEIDNEKTDLYFKNVGDNTYRQVTAEEAAGDNTVSVNTVKLVMPSKDRESIIIHGMTPGKEYRVEEVTDFAASIEEKGYTIRIDGSPEANQANEFGGKHARTKQPGIKENETIEVTITNTVKPKTGTLVVEKVITGTKLDGKAIDADWALGTFRNKMKFTLYDQYGDKVTGLKSDGWGGNPPTTLDNTNYGSLRALSDYSDNRVGAKIVFTNVPVGTYYVVETGAEVKGLALTKKLNDNTINTTGMAEDSNQYRNAFKAGQVTVKADGTATLTLENNYERKLTEVPVKKEWNDNGDEYGFRPDEVKIQVKLKASNSDDAVAEYTLVAAENWEHTFTDLPTVDNNGNPIEYTVEEEPVPGYSSEVRENKDGSFTIINTPDDPSTFYGGKRGDVTPDKSKYVTYRNDGTYDLTLTMQGVKGNEKYKVDVLFVVDLSSSMRYQMSSENVAQYASYSRLGELVKVKDNLVTNISKNQNVDARYSIVSFDGYYYDNTYTDAEVLLDWTSSAQSAQTSLTTAYLRNNDNYGTNYTAGLRETASQLNKARDNAQTIVVFISDGAPTLYTTYYNGRVWSRGGNGNYYNNNVPTCLWYATEMAKGITANQFYTVAIGTSNTNATLNTHQNLIRVSNAVTADKKDNYDATDAAALARHFATIENNIVSVPISNAEIHDTLNSRVEFVTGKNGNELTELRLEVQNAAGQTVAKSNVAASAKTASVQFNDQGKRVTATLTRNGNDVSVKFTTNDGSVYRLNPNFRFLATMRIEPNAGAYLDYQANNYPNTGDAGTGATSAGKRGYFSNKNDDAYISYNYKDEPGYKEYYDKPVVQLFTKEVTVTKKWLDGKNAGKTRPNSITVGAFGEDGKLAGYVVLTGGATADSWTGKITNLRKWKGGEEIRYTVKELKTGVELANAKDSDWITSGTNGSYTVVITGNEANGFEVKNTLETINISVTKKWVDENNEDNVRPSEIRFALFKGNSNTPLKDVTMDKPANATGNDWVFTNLFTDLPKTENGQAVVYTVKEWSPTRKAWIIAGEYNADYKESSRSGDAASGFVFTNKHTKNTVSVSVEKIWKDSDNEANARPQTIKVQLYADGVAEGDAVTLPRKENGVDVWDYTWTNLPENKKGASGQKIVYTVDEVSGFTGYTKVITGDAKTGFVITNTYNEVPFTITVKKEWDDKDDQDNVRPEINVELLADGTVVKTAKLEASNGYAKTWSSVTDGLAKYRTGQVGQLVQYTVQEVGETNGKIAGKNTADGEATEYTVTYTASPKVNGNNKGVAHDGTMTIKNSYTPKVVNIVATKSWNDSNNVAGKRPDSLKFTLSKDGSTYEEQTVTATQSWKYTWSNLPKYDKGRLINYTVTEGAVPDYTGRSGDPQTSTTGNTTTFSFENTYKPGKVDIKVVKNWSDGDNQDDVRPGSIQVQLQRRVKVASGTQNQWENVGNPVTIGQNTTPVAWAHTFAGQDIYAAGQQGKEYEYQVIEVGDKVEGNKYWISKTDDRYYTISYPASTDANTTIINNDYTPETVDVPVKKIWDDENNQDGKRPGKVVVQLFADGRAVDKGEVELNEGNKWTHTFQKLPKYNKSTTPIEYTMMEYKMTENGMVLASFVIPKAANQDPDSFIDGIYTGTYGTEPPEDITGAPAGYKLPHATLTVTNKHVPETIDIPIEKIWNDTNYEDVRPASVTVELVRKDGKNLPAGVTAQKTLSGKAATDDTWSDKWEKLPKYENGVEIEYDVKEIAVTATNGKAYQVVKTGDRISGFKITNTYVPEPLNIPVIKVWDDANNYDKLRPSTIIVGLFANGSLVEYKQLRESDKEVKDAGGNGISWSYIFKDLPERDKKGVITYTIRELKKDGSVDEEDDWIAAGAAVVYSVDADGNPVYTATVGTDTVENRHAPKIEKDINGKTEHQVQTKTEKFAYTVKTAVPDGKDSQGAEVTKFEITDTLESVLKFESTAAQVEVKVGGAVVTGTNRPAVTTQGQLLTVTFTGTSLKNAAGKAVEVKFEASILPNANLTPYEDDTTGEVKIPNTAQYKINNDPGESNEVYVKPFFGTIDIPVTKKWQGMAAPADKTITVGLFNKEQLENGKVKAGEEPVATKLLNAGKNWTDTFTELQKERIDGTEIEYVVMELGEGGAWVSAGKGDGAWLVSIKGYDVTNTGGEKGIAEDGTASDQDGAADGAYKITNRDEVWTYTINTAVPVGEDVKNFIITDTLNDLLRFADDPQLTVKVNGSAVTVGNQSLEVAQAGTTAAPKTLTVRFGPAQLMNGNTPVASLPDTLQGKSVEITFRAQLADGVTDTQLAPYMSQGGVPNTATITLNNDFSTDTNEVRVKKDPKYVEVEVQKKWAGDAETDRPATVTVGLFANDTAGTSQAPYEGKTAVLTAPDWKATFANLPEDDANGIITYTVKELAANGRWIKTGQYNGRYVVTFDGNDPTNTAVTKKVKADGEGTTSADGTRADLAANNETFTYTLKTAIPEGDGIKTFVITDKLEPVLEFVSESDDVTVTWAADGTKVDPQPAVTVDKDTNTLTVNFGDEGATADLPASLRGKEFVVSFQAKFTAEALADETGTLLAPYTNMEVPNKANININNTFNVDSNIVHVVPKVEKVDVKVTKEWQGETANDARRPAAVPVALFTRKNGVDTYTGKRATLTALENWTATWTGLIKTDSEGVDYKYIVKEASAIDAQGNVTAWTDLGVDASGNYLVSLSGSMLEQKVTNTTITKKVNDSTQSAAVKREEAFTYKLNTVIPESADIKNFIVTDELEPVLAFVSTAAQVQVTPAATEVKIDGQKLTVRFGPETVNENTPSLATRGQAVTITFQAKVPEDADVTGYTNYEVPNKASFKVNNTFDVESNEVVVIPDVETIDIEVKKEWVNAQELTKPASVTVGIFQVGLGENGADRQYGADVLLNAGNNWTHKFENLPKTTQAGTKIDYVVKERGADSEWTQLGKGGNAQDGTFIISANGTSLQNIGVVKDVNGEDSYNVAAENADEVFTYNITTTIPDAEGTKNFTITDQLESVLDFVSTQGQVVVTVGGQPAATSGDDKPEVIIDGQILTVRFGPKTVDANTNDLSDALKGKEVKVSFDAKIRASADISGYVNRMVPNKATVDVNNSFKIDSNIVHVTDEEHTVDIPVEKKFANGELKNKPEYVTVGVFEKGGNEDGTDRKVGQENLSKDNNWKHVFRNLPEYNTKEEKITYVVKELGTDGQWKELGSYNNTFFVSVKETANMPYTVKTTGEDGKETTTDKKADGFTVTNTGITKNVEADGEGTTNADKTHADLAAEDETFTYTINTTIPDGEGVKSFVVEDTLESILEFVDESAISVTPASGKATFGTGTDSKGNTGRKLIVTWGNPAAKETDPDMTEKGQAVVITFQAKVKAGAPNLSLYTDKKVPNKTTFKVNNDYTTESNIVTVTPKVEDIKIPVKKNWQGIAAPADKSVTVGVFRSVTTVDNNGDPVVTEEGPVKQDQVNKDNNWAVTFEGLDKYDANSNEYKYTVKELGANGAWVTVGKGEGAWLVSIDGYDVTNTGTVKGIAEDGTASDEDGAKDGKYEITNRDEVWTYTIDTAIPVGEDVKNFIITDTLNDLLQFADDPELTVYVGGDQDANKVTVGQQSLTVAEAGNTTAAKTLTVQFGPTKISEEVNGEIVYVVDSLPDTLQGKSVKVTFKARLADGVTDEQLAPYMTAAVGGVPNTATIKLNNDFDTDSNEVKIWKEPRFVEIPVTKEWKGETGEGNVISNMNRPANIVVGAFKVKNGKPAAEPFKELTLEATKYYAGRFIELPEEDEDGIVTWVVMEKAEDGTWTPLGKVDGTYTISIEYGKDAEGNKVASLINQTITKDVNGKREWKVNNQVAGGAFTYNLNTFIPAGEGVKNFTISDTLDDLLEFAGTNGNVKVYVGGAEYTGSDMTVAVDPDAKTLNVRFGPELVMENGKPKKDDDGYFIDAKTGDPVVDDLGTALQGKSVRVSFLAKTIDGINEQMLIDAGYQTGKIPNGATYEINNEHETDSNIVLVEPDIEKVEISVEKVWKGDALNDAEREDYVEIAVFNANDLQTPLEEKTLTKADNWKHTFSGLLKKNADGSLAKYVVLEKNEAGNWVAIGKLKNGWTLSVTGAQEPGENGSYKVVNQTITKTIDDENEQGETIEVNHRAVERGNENAFTYNLHTAIPAGDGTVNFTITDKLDKALSFANPVELTVKVNGQVYTNTQYLEVAEADTATNTLTIRFGPEQVAIAGPGNQSVMQKAPLPASLRGADVDVSFKAFVLPGADLSGAEYDNGKVPNQASYRINNTYETESNIVTVVPDVPVKDVPVIKLWKNNGKMDKMPEYVTVALFDAVTDEKVSDDVQIRPDAKGEWKHTFKDVQKYRTGTVDEEIDYVVKELDKEGNFVALGKGKDGAFTISAKGTTLTNTGIEKTVNVNGTEKPADSVETGKEFQYVIRTTIPDTEGVKNFIIEDELEPVLEWAGTDKNGDVEVKVDGSVVTPDYLGTANKTLVVRFGPALKLGQDGKPEKDAEGWFINAEDGSQVKDDLTIKGKPVQITFTVVVPKGTDLSAYEIMNGEIPNDSVYRINNDFDTESNIVKVTPTEETVDVPVKKIWANDGKITKPVSVTVAVFDEDEPNKVIRTATLNNANNWETVFEKLRKFKPVNGDPKGKEIVYIVKERNADDTEWITLGNYNGTFGISVLKEAGMTYKVTETAGGQETEVEKTADGYRITNIGITKEVTGYVVDENDEYELDVNGQKVVANAGNKDKLDIGKSLKPFTYTINTTIPDANGTKTFVVTDTLEKVLEFVEADANATTDAAKYGISVTPAGAEVTVDVASRTLTVTWGPETTYMQENGQDVLDANGDKVPVDLTVKGQAVEISFDAKVKAGVKEADLRAYANGEVPNGASYKINNGSKVDSNKVVVTPEPNKVIVKVTKDWQGEDPAQANRPPAITVGLFRNGVQMNGRIAVLNKGNDWTATFDELDEFDANSQPYVYDVRELSAKDGEWIFLGEYNDKYLVSREETAEDGTKLINTTATKTVDKPKLTNANEEFTYTIKTVVPTGEGVKSFTVTDELEPVLRFIVKDDQATDDAAKYGVTVSGIDATTVSVDEDSRTLKVTWGPETETMKDESGADVLDANGNKVPVDLKTGGDVTVTFSARVREDADIDALMKYLDSADNGIPNEVTIDINNEYSATPDRVIVEPKLPSVDVEVEKKWDDMDNKDKIRDKEITLTLYANGNEVKVDQDGNPVENPVKINEAGNWKYTWTNLPKYANSERIPVRYTVKESGVHESYTHDSNNPLDYRLVKLDESGDETTDDNAIVKYEIEMWNRYTPDETQYKVVKFWDDADNQDGFREDIYVQLYMKNADGELVPVEPYDYYALDLDENGKMQYNADGSIRRKAKSETIETLVTLAKPENDTDARVSHTWLGLPKNHAGKKTVIEYFVMEIANPAESVELVNNAGEPVKKLEDNVNKNVLADGAKLLGGEYTVSYVKDKTVVNDQETVDKYSTEIVNKHVPYTTKIKVAKTWADAKDHDKKRPETIELIITGTADVEIDNEGNKYTKVYRWNLTKADLEKENVWVHVFDNNGENLPVYYKGKKISYTVKEVEVEGYASAHLTEVTDGTSQEQLISVALDNAHNPPPVKTIEDSKELTKIAENKAMLKLRESVFTFKIEAAVPEGKFVNKKGEVEELKKFVVYDKVIDDIEIDKASIKVEDAQSKGVLKVDGQEITVTYEGEALKAVQGKVVTVTFSGKLKADADASKYLVPNAAGVSYDGFPNTAEAQFNPDDEDGVRLETEPVTIIPPNPPITKEVGLAADSEGKVNAAKDHAELALRNEVITYTVKTELPEREVTSFVITDKVVEELVIADSDKATVTVEGGKGKAPDVTISGNTVKVSFTDADYLKANAGREVTLVFYAKIADGANISHYFEEGKDGVPNTASYTCELPKGDPVTKDSNEVTVEPPEPEVEKTVNNVKTYELKDSREAVTYTIATQIPEKQLVSFVITDTLKDVLEFVSKENEVRVKEFTLDAQGNRIAGANVGAKVSISGQTLKVEIAEEYLKVSKGKPVMVEFEAKIRDDATAAQLKPYLVDVATGIPNEAAYTYKAPNDPKEYGKPTPPVYIIPADPEIRKNVENEKGESHKDLRLHADLVARYGIHPYTITTSIPKKPDVESFTIHDELEQNDENRVLEYVSKAAEVEITVGGKKIGSNDATVTIDANRRVLDVVFGGDYVNAHMGEEVIVKFNAKIVDGADLIRPKDYTVVLQDYPEAPHTGHVRVPNQASYLIAYSANAVADDQAQGDTDNSDTAMNGNARGLAATPGFAAEESSRGLTKVYSNYVTVTPPDDKVTKEVSNAAGNNADKTHLDLTDWDEVFNYTINARIPEKANLTKTEVTDTLEQALAFSPADGNVRVTADGGTTLKEGTDYTKTVNGKTLTVSFTKPYMDNNRGQIVHVSFNAKIVEGADLSKYPKTAVGDLPMVPNTAGFRYVFGNNPEVTDESEPVTVTPKPEYVSIPVEKIWADSNNSDGARPDEITVRVFDDNHVQVASAKLTAADNWKHTFEQLPKFVNGKIGVPVKYTVEEDGVAGYGKPQITTAANGTVTITNPYTPGRTRVTVVKTWNDADNAAGTRPSSITVELVADGTKTGKTITLNEAGGWRGAFEDLELKNASGGTISYTVAEIAVDGYTTTVAPMDANSGETAYAFLITNTAENGRLTVVKRVSGAPAGTSITYTFIISDETGAEVTRVSITGDGSQTITLPVGVYTVSEVGAGQSTIAQYTMMTAGNGQRIRVVAGADATATIVNTYTPPTTPPPGGDQQGDRRPQAPTEPTTQPVPERTPQQAPPPIEAGQVLGVRRTNSENVLGARRGKTGDRHNDSRLLTMMMSGAAALLALIGGKRKRKEEA